MKHINLRLDSSCVYTKNASGVAVGSPRHTRWSRKVLVATCGSSHSTTCFLWASPQPACCHNQNNSAVISAIHKTTYLHKPLGKQWSFMFNCCSIICKSNC